jgi:hypothetical protein
MQPGVPFPIRTECPPALCNCGRDALLEQPDADLRILRLTREEEKRLLARLEAISDYADLQKMQQKLFDLLGVRVTIAPGPNEVRTLRGLLIQIADHPGLCRKTRQAIPQSLRRAFEQRPEIVYAILDAHDLLGQ